MRIRKTKRSSSNKSNKVSTNTEVAPPKEIQNNTNTQTNTPVSIYDLVDLNSFVEDNLINNEIKTVVEEDNADTYDESPTDIIQKTVMSNPEEQLNSINPESLINNKNEDLIKDDKPSAYKSFLQEFEPDRKKIPPTTVDKVHCIKNKDIKIINHILEVLRLFKYQLKDVDSVRPVERINIDNQDCFCYFYSLFYERMQQFTPSTEFIYNSKISGNSSSILFYTFDFKFAIKTVRKTEIQTALDLIEKFDAHYKKGKRSLIAPILGIYSTPLCYFIVMKNVFNNPHDTIFDLKGADVNRRKAKNANECVSVEKDWKGRTLLINDRDRIVDVLKADSRFLRKLGLMDYSLLVGLSYNDSHYFRLFNSQGKDKGAVKTLTSGYKQSYGIIDVFTVYDWKKKTETFLNKIFCCKNPSCVDPATYSKRFIEMINGDFFEEIE